MTEQDLMRILGQAFQRVGEQLAASAEPKQAAKVEPLFMTVKQYAATRGYSEGAIRKWIKIGMPAAKTGRGHRVRVGAADQWLDAGGPATALERMARNG
jgi:hypothetical protein